MGEPEASPNEMVEVPFVEARDWTVPIDDWCYVHNSPEATDTYPLQDTRHCLWDLRAGPRPGRGPCKFGKAKVTVEIPSPPLG